MNRPRSLTTEQVRDGRAALDASIEELMGVAGMMNLAGEALLRAVDHQKAVAKIFGEADMSAGGQQGGRHDSNGTDN